jgi:hypothetical protein
MGNSPAGNGSEEKKKNISFLKIKPQSFRHQGFTLFVNSNKKELFRDVYNTSFIHFFGYWKYYAVK